MKKRSIMLLSVMCYFIVSTSSGKAEPYTVLMRKGNRYFRNALYRDAAEFFWKGREKNRKSSVPSFNGGAALYKLEDYTGSIRALNEALTRTDDDERTSQIHYNLGNNYFNLGEYSKAVEHYRAGLKIDPYDLNLKYNLELALKKLTEGTPQPEKSEEPGNGDEKGGETDGGKEIQEQESTDNTEQERDEFTAEDAARLVNSVNTDQSQIINELIQSRVGKVQNENDW
jgi:tetratricopeptide (TPR) repeat protein